MSDRKQARELMDAAGRDLSALRGMGDACVFTDEVFGFHVQQAVEKYFMAWIALSGGLYPTTHDLADLLSALKDRDAAAVDFDDLVQYTPYAVRFRYAGVSGHPLDREHLVQRVEALLERVRRSMGRG